MQRRVSLKDVARAAGVHVSTVSRALSRETAKLLSPAVAERIQAVAEEMGYCPNAMAAALRTSRSGAVGMVVPDLTHPAFSVMLRGADEVLGAAGYVPVILSVEHDFRRTSALLRELRGRRVDGILIATAQVDDPFIAAVAREATPMVAINATDIEGAPFPGVVADEAAGVAMVMDHLRDLGHVQISHLAGPAATLTGQARMAAFVANGGDPLWTEHASAYDRAGGHAACHRLLDRFPPGRPGGLTAIVTANDLLALGCLDVLRERGLRCPDDVSLTGFMDLPNMDLIDPPLTTVRVDLLGMGRCAAQKLLSLLTVGAGPQPKMEIMPTSLVVRRSCRPMA
ncbi:MAG TPA: LacI family DNA-binding transcriptional regulator [Magnetospirillum sp.]|jgi:LacI family transcriptional regulator|nr:LacI family DNA-binding transcriptional regulator [Magnetospirillum sp.]